MKLTNCNHGGGHKNSRISGLNIIRILSTLWVLLFHASSIYQFRTGINFIDKLISVGAIGCTIFFMLSGFGLRQKYRNLQEKGKMKQYCLKRFIAIYPIYLFFLTVSYLLHCNIGSLKEILLFLPAQLFGLQILAFPQTISYSFNNNFWYINVLFILYLLYPYLNELLNRYQPKKIAHYIFIILILILCSEYFYYVCIYVGNVGNGYSIYYFNPLLRIPEFFIGMIMSDFIGKIKFEKQWKSVTIMVITSILTLLLFVLLIPIFSNNYNLYNIIILPYMVMLIICIKDNKILNKIGSFKVIQYIASLGLTIYLSQSISVYIEQVKNIHSPLVFIFLSIVLAIVIHEVVEKPSNKFLKKKLLK